MHVMCLMNDLIVFCTVLLYLGVKNSFTFLQEFERSRSQRDVGTGTWRAD